MIVIITNALVDILMIDTLNQVKDDAVFCPFIIWLVGRSAQKVQDRFPRNMDTRGIVAQNTPC